MSDLDPKGLQAAYDAYEKANPYDIFYPAVEAAIRAYEVHKASAVPEEIVEVVAKLRAYNGDIVPIPLMTRAADLLERQAREIEHLEAGLRMQHEQIDHLHDLLPPKPITPP